MAGERFDTIVLGLGAMGSAALYHLARRGDRVIGIEQYGVPHSRGSSHGYSRAIRLCYYEHPDYVPLLKRAYDLWRELERETQLKLLHVTGGLYMGRADHEVVRGSRRAGEAHGLPHEMMSRAQINAKFPQFQLPEDFVGLYEPNAGFLIPELVIAAHLGLSARLGAAVRTHERIRLWRDEGDGVVVTTERGLYRAKRLIISAGAYADHVLGELAPGIRIRATRQVLGWVQPHRPELFQLGVLPVWAIAPPSDDSGMYYGFPMMQPRQATDPTGFKLARHARGPEVDPEQNDWSAQPEDESDFRPALRDYMPDADGPVTAMKVCLYENSPDGHFIVDRLPRQRNVIVAAGFSGHGFKFASVMGEILADLAREGRTDHPIDFLSLRRFAYG